MNPLFRIDFSISDSLKIVRKSVLIYETIIEQVGVCGFEIENAITNAVVSGKLVIRTADRKYRCSIKETKKIIKD